MGKKGSGAKMIANDFYCMKCGNKGLDVLRKRGKQKEKFHRKKMYCLYCRIEVNHIECRNLIEIEEFKEKFEAGEFIQEVEDSIAHIQEYDINRLF